MNMPFVETETLTITRKMQELARLEHVIDELYAENSFLLKIFSSILYDCETLINNSITKPLNR